MITQFDGMIRLILVRPFVDHIRSLGFDPDPILNEWGLSSDKVQNPDISVHADTIYGLVNRLADHARDPFLGCHVGEQFDLSRWPVLTEAAQDASSIGDFYTRFVQLVPQQASSVRHELAIRADTTTYAVMRIVSTKASTAHIDGFGLAMHTRLLQMVTGAQWAPSRLILHTAYPQALPRGYLGATILRHDRNGLALTFPTKWLHHKIALQLPSQTPAPNDIALSLIVALRTAAKPHLSQQVISQDQLAADLGMSLSALKAGLKRQGTTLPRELKALKIRLACQALADPKRTISDIGQSLGYADPSHFARFFKSQTGTSPSAHRAAQVNSSH
ncbi:helix-turn-helix domain-containing protein [Shimia abyssi]|uniref:AraC-like DNA-binding protein n=1 Tax=Shimia abyssi TaxID=1662395 RepID=A0A2P8FIN8_9RHOB|nr:AraC family transcriptional regulator [Shimia abyssi]PSL21583.1 AraC-like DNA-binding protein [Shimia abyssi]